LIEIRYLFPIYDYMINFGEARQAISIVGFKQVSSLYAGADSKERHQAAAYAQTTVQASNLATDGGVDRKSTGQAGANVYNIGTLPVARAYPAAACRTILASLGAYWTLDHIPQQ
jgi:hypothetical protein